jgi:hypothetical protein
LDNDTKLSQIQEIKEIIDLLQLADEDKSAVLNCTTNKVRDVLPKAIDLAKQHHLKRKKMRGERRKPQQTDTPKKNIHDLKTEVENNPKIRGGLKALLRQTANNGDCSKTFLTISSVSFAYLNCLYGTIKNDSKKTLSEFDNLSDLIKLLFSLQEEGEKEADNVLNDNVLNCTAKQLADTILKAIDLIRGYRATINANRSKKKTSR